MRFSATRLFVAEAGCLWPFRSDVWPPAEPENDAMRRGKSIHAAIEAATILGAPPEPTSEIARIARHAFEWQRDEFKGERFVEHVIGIDLANGTAKAGYKTKDDVPKSHMPVIVDLCVIGESGVQVWDYKSGNPNSKFDYAPQARANGLAVALATGADLVRTGLAYVSETGVTTKHWSLLASDIEQQRDRLMKWAKEAPTAEAVPCAACRYCPARSICPAQNQTQKPTPKPAERESVMSTTMRVSLAQVIKGKLEKPPRILLFGVEKIGKSSFAAASPAPIFLCSEDGTAELNVARFPQPENWTEVLGAISELTLQTHDYKTLVIDTLDWLEPLCWNRTIETRGKNPADYSIEDFGYAKGYVYALDVWRELLSRLDSLRATTNMGVVLLAHAWIKPFKNPEGDDYDRYEMKLHAKAGGLIREWCDAVLFATYETFVKKSKEKGGRAKAFDSGARIVHTQRRAAWDAGNRYDLPETLPLDWQSFTDAVKNRSPESPSKLKEQIGEMLGRITDKELHAKITRTVAEVGNNGAELARIANKLSAIIKGEAA